jgi:hypothetical protein
MRSPQGCQAGAHNAGVRRRADRGRLGYSRRNRRRVSSRCRAGPRRRRSPARRADRLAPTWQDRREPAVGRSCEAGSLPAPGALAALPREATEARSTPTNRSPSPRSWRQQAAQPCPSRHRDHRGRMTPKPARTSPARKAKARAASGQSAASSATSHATTPSSCSNRRRDHANPRSARCSRQLDTACDRRKSASDEVPSNAQGAMDGTTI